MSVDVEEHFHVMAFSGIVSEADWLRLPSRVEQNTHRILELFENTGTRATFFVLGWIAERFPGLVRDMATSGHEVASHGYSHVPAHQQTPAEFREDITRTKSILEQLSGAPVIGYRAASFSVGAGNQWAFDEIERAGYRYSSSVYPIAHDIYGFPEAPRFRFVPKGTNLIECPPTTVQVGGRRWACGGGGYFRVFPYPAFRWALRRVRKDDGESCFFYFHPWEVDPEQPRFSKAPLRSRFRHYVNLHRMESRLQHLLSDFRWDRYDTVLGLR
jgi:polysaccharide deacetylase family protein (PEP-CTERM system associated)